MRLDEAVEILGLEGEPALSRAEEAFESIASAARAELAQLPVDADRRAEVEAKLARLVEAIEVVRRSRDPEAKLARLVEAIDVVRRSRDPEAMLTAGTVDPDATVVGPAVGPDDLAAADSEPDAPAPPEPDDQDLTVISEPVDPDATIVSEPVDPDATVISEAVDTELAAVGDAVSPASSPAPAGPVDRIRNLPRSWLIGGAGGLALLVLLLLLLPGGEDQSSPPSPPSPPVADSKAAVKALPEAVQMRVLGGRWLSAIDQLQKNRDELLKALADAGDDEWGRRLREEVVDQATLDEMTRTLRTPFPTDQGLEAAQGAYSALFEQLSEARKRVQRLQALQQELPAPVPPSDEPAGPTTTKLVAVPEAAGRGKAKAEAGPAPEVPEEAVTPTTAAAAPAPEPSLPLPDEGEIAALYEQGMDAVARDRLTRPADESALDYLRAIKALDPDSTEAVELADAIEGRFLALIERNLAAGNPDRADTLASRALRVLGPSAGLQAAANNVRTQRRIAAERQFQPGQRVVEITGLPMVTLPTGSFEMGTPTGRAGARNLIGGLGGLFGSRVAGYDPDSERPVHRVQIDRMIAFSLREVSVAQFRRFVEATGYVTEAEQSGAVIAHQAAGDTRVPGRNWRHDYLGEPAPDEAPVIHVSFNDANAFARWLSIEAQARYRLPSESEFEYALRAGGDIYPWGDGLPPDGFRNFRGEKDSPPADWQAVSGSADVRGVRGYSDGYFGPAPVDSYKANAFGLKNLLGNVSEWTADCYLPDYQGKGAGQQPRDTQACEQRVVRGTSWATDARLLRASWRGSHPANYSSNTVGFRLVREVNIPDS